MLLQATNIKKYHGKSLILQGVNITAHRGEVISIMGNSGAGKTTSLYLLATFDQPDEGTIFLNGENIQKLKGDRLAQFRNKNIGFVFQLHHLLPEFTALENVCLPGYLGGFDKKIVEKRGKELLELLQLTPRSNDKPANLSGGELQRVAMARALINNPQIVFADEPSGSLDTKNGSVLHQLLLDLSDQLGQTCLFVTHNQEYAAMATRQLLMQDGKLLNQD